MKVIARICCDYTDKFGIPRQSGLVSALEQRIVFEPEFRDPEALRGLEDFDYIWLIWDFSESHRDHFAPTVRPPRLGGNTRMGVFATRSPFRPNPIGLSSVRLLRIEWKTEQGPVLIVQGADLLDGTPLYDIKPYLPYTDAHPEASGGFAEGLQMYQLEVEIPEEELVKLPVEKREGLRQVLREDPRPSYQNDPERIYGFTFGQYEVRFTVADGLLRVREIIPLQESL
ncbi:MAG: tRNA (N6-threonylcarbamoyladenosine(37)-N6)-methyltransferase TrmO [Firmicutes bacterium]|nr:tRNA (N6-threonylcarbamoyladenosine(37)-N6)-methyltransferase TrmO [Bacillota bacterium]